MLIFMKKSYFLVFYFLVFIFFLFPGSITPSAPSKSSLPESKLSCAEHILYGCPSTSGTILCRQGYVLDHDNTKKVATWVSYHLTDKYLVQNVRRTDDFRPDLDLPKGQRSELIDYDHSGYDRGHLCPADDMRRDLQTESETFLLSNMTPQIGVGFNRGIWKDLESKVREWAKQRKNIYVITGPIFENQNYKTVGPNKVVVPIAFYKIIVSCTLKGDNLDVIAFILPNKEIPTIELPQYVTTIDEVEKQTGITLLVVEDNDKLRLNMCESLEDYYHVIACNNASKAIEVCKTTRVDLILSDIVMNLVDGISFCETVKQELKLNIPIILITGLDSSDIEIKSYNSGADAFIRKPFEFDILLARIQNLLKTKGNASPQVFKHTGEKIQPQDEAFASKLKAEIEKGIPNPDFSVEGLAKIMGSSRANLFRKSKKILGVSPSEYIQHARMQVAATILKEKKHRISEVAYMVGFTEPRYFSNCFSKHFGMSPSDYQTKS